MNILLICFSFVLLIICSPTDRNSTAIHTIFMFKLNEIAVVKKVYIWNYFQSINNYYSLFSAFVFVFINVCTYRFLAIISLKKQTHQISMKGTLCSKSLNWKRIRVKYVLSLCIFKYKHTYIQLFKC